MPRDIINVDETLTKMLLNLYSEKTNLPAVIYLEGNEDKPIFSDLYWPKFCKKICDSIKVENGCGKEYSQLSDKKFGLHICFAGLCCYSQPIEVDGKVIGILLTGQIILKNKKEESKRILQETLVKYNLNKKQSKELEELWNNVQSINESEFDKTFIEHLIAIERYIIIEHKRIDELKSITVHSVHEIILPIQSIVANAENLYIELEEPEYREIAKDILEQMRKLGYITENIIGSDKDKDIEEYKKEFRRVIIFPMIQDTINLFRKEAIKKGVTIRDPIKKNAPFSNIEMSKIEMSEPHIKQVLFNLIHNAVKYSYAGTEELERYISIICSSQSDFYCIEITNFGIGVTQNEISKELIFKNGYRGELARDRSRTGSGFGLSVVKQIIEMHNGYIKIESKNLGSGLKIDPYKTTIKVCIPYNQPRGNKFEKTKNIMGRR